MTTLRRILQQTKRDADTPEEGQLSSPGRSSTTRNRTATHSVPTLGRRTSSSSNGIPQPTPGSSHRPRGLTPRQNLDFDQERDDSEVTGGEAEDRSSLGEESKPTSGLEKKKPGRKRGGARNWHEVSIESEVERASMKSPRQAKGPKRKADDPTNSEGTSSPRQELEDARDDQGDESTTTTTAREKSDKAKRGSASEEDTKDRHKHKENGELSTEDTGIQNIKWVQCESCKKWRKLPPNISASSLPETWVCSMNTWNDATASCLVKEEDDSADDNAIVAVQLNDACAAKTATKSFLPPGINLYGGQHVLPHHIAAPGAKAARTMSYRELIAAHYKNHKGFSKTYDQVCDSRFKAYSAYQSTTLKDRPFHNSSSWLEAACQSTLQVPPKKRCKLS